MSIYSKYLYPNLNFYVYKGEKSIKEWETSFTDLLRNVY
jgi:hypothetical protein